MRIWIVNHYSQPPNSPGGTRHYSLARALVELGHEVVIVASSFHHQQRTEKVLEPGEKFRRLDYNGVKFVWLRGLPYRGNATRVLNMIHFAWHVFTETGLRGLPRPDIIMGSSVHLFTPFAAYWLARRFKVPIVLEIRDLWPQTLIDIAGMRSWHPLVIAMGIMERFLYRVADRIVTVLPGSEEYIVSKGGRALDIVWIPNFVDVSQVRLVNQNNEPPSHFTVMYAGSHGTANSLDTIIDAAQILANDGWNTRIRICLLGDGPCKPELKELAGRANLTNIHFWDSVPKSEVYAILEAADAFIISSKKTNLYRWGLSPNKLFDYLAMGKPVIYGLDSKYNPVQEANAGITVPAEDARAIAEAIKTLAEMPSEERWEMGLRGRQYVEEFHDVQKLVRRLEDLFRELHDQRETTKDNN